MCLDVMYSRESDVCVVSLVYIHTGHAGKFTVGKISDYGGNRTHNRSRYELRITHKQHEWLNSYVKPGASCTKVACCDCDLVNNDEKA